MNYHFKNLRWGKSLFVGVALLLSSCAALPSVINSSPLISSSTSQAPGRTWQDRIMNAYVADGSDSQGLAYFKSDTVNSSGTYDTCVSLGTCTLASITIPSTRNGNPIVGIKEQGFAGYSALTSVTLPTASTFTWIGSEAFADTSITTLTIPASVTTINPSAFFNCAQLAYLYFSSGSALTMIDEYAFANCGLLYQCRLPASVVTIGAAAFQGDYSIVRMVLPKNLTTIGAGAFIDCNQMNLTYFPHNVTTVGAYAFKGCYNTQAYFSDSDATGQTAFATNWDYVGTAYTLNSGSALLKKNYNKPNLNYNSDYIYIQADPSVTASNYDVNIIAYIGTDNSSAAGSVNLDASGRGVVPASIADVDDSTIQHKVIGVNSYAFQNHTELGNVVFGSSSDPSNIKTISAYAFQGCDNLKVLDFNYASSLQTIGAYAFQHGATSNITVKNLYIPASVSEIGAYAFPDFTKLQSLTFQDESSATLYSHLSSIGDHAFLNAGSTAYSAGSPSSFALTLPCNYLANIWNSAFENARFIASLVFSSTKTNPALVDSAVASLYIRNAAFKNDYSLETVTFSSHVTRLGDNAFQIESLNTSNWPGVKSFFLPSTIATIDGASVFYGQNRATIYCGPATQPSAWNSGNRINNTELSVGLYHDDDYADHNQLPIYYNVGDAVGQRHLIHSVNGTSGTFDFLTVADATGALTSSTAICTRFYYAGSHSTTFTPKVPATINGTYNNIAVTYTINGIGQTAFYFSSTGANGSITKVTLPVAIVSFGDVAFTNCKYLTEVSSYSGTTTYQYRLPQSLTTIGAYMFAHDPITTMKIPSTLTSIGSTIFEGCTKLTSLTMVDASGTTVENGTSYSCISNMVYIGSTPTELNTGALGATMDAATNTLAIADGVTKIDSYALHSDVGIKHITAPATITTIDSYSIRDVDSLLSFRFRAGADNSLTPALTIGNYAFDNNNNMTTMEMPKRLTRIGDIAFWGNYALKHFPTTSTQTVDEASTDGVLDLSGCTNLSYVGAQAFQNCSSIRSLTLPDTTSLTTLGANAFNNCTALTTVNLGNHLSSFGNNCFSACTALTSVNTGTSMISLGDNTFNGDTSLTSVTLGSSVTTIGGSCFLNTKLTSLTIPNSVTSIGGNAFNGVSTMASVTFGDGTSSSIIGRSGTLTINKLAFANCTNASFTKIVIPDNAKFAAPGTDYAFNKDSQLTIYLGCTKANFTTANYPTGWNYRDNSLTSTALPFKLYSATTPTDSTYSYWHYVGTTPTAW